MSGLGQQRRTFDACFLNRKIFLIRGGSQARQQFFETYDQQQGRAVDSGRHSVINGDETEEFDDSDDDRDEMTREQQQQRQGSILSSPFLDHFQEEVHDLVCDYRDDVRKTFRELKHSIAPSDSTTVRENIRDTSESNSSCIYEEEESRVMERQPGRTEKTYDELDQDENEKEQDIAQRDGPMFRDQDVTVVSSSNTAHDHAVVSSSNTAHDHAPLFLQQTMRATKYYGSL